jgi:integrase
MHRRVVVLRNTKNGENRGVPLSKQALCAVERALCLHGEERVFPLRERQLARLWRALCEAAQIKDSRFHDLRHEATSRLFERGLMVMEVQRITGHKTLAMLLRYTQMYDNHVLARLDSTDALDSAAMANPRFKNAETDKRVVQSSQKSNVVLFRPRRQ